MLLLLLLLVLTTGLEEEAETVPVEEEDEEEDEDAARDRFAQLDWPVRDSVEVPTGQLVQKVWPVRLV